MELLPVRQPDRAPGAGVAAAEVRLGRDVSYARATLARQLSSRRQLFEVMVDFWANHLNVPMPSDGAWDVGVHYHNSVIRRNALGSFETMLIAACRHPGLLRTLSNDQSRKESVNENLGRELLELHTVGLEAKYTEADVRNSAYILTGRTVADNGLYHYEPSWHYTGAVRVMDFHTTNRSPEGGFAVGDAYLRYLARHPMTARHIARKLAIRFISDTPSEAMVAMLASVYLRHGTQIRPVLTALFATTTFARSIGVKTRRPLESVVASMRAAEVTIAPQSKGLEWLYWNMVELGHAPLGWPAPNGYPDVAAAWASPGGMVGTWNVQRRMLLKEYAGMTTPDVHALAGNARTVGAFVDALSQRLLGQRMSAARRPAVIAFTGQPESAPVSTLANGQLDLQVAGLILGSPYLAIR